MDVKSFLEELPFVDLLGITFPVIEDGHAEGALGMRSELSWTTESQRAHAGVTFTLAEATGAAAVVATNDPPVYTVDMRIDYLDAPHGDLRSSADVLRDGDDIGVADVTVRDARDELVAVARAAYKLR